jgi:hypothetical protein
MSLFPKMKGEDPTGPKDDGPTGHNGGPKDGPKGDEHDHKENDVKSSCVTINIFCGDCGEKKKD